MDYKGLVMSDVADVFFLTAMSILSAKIGSGRLYIQSKICLRHQELADVSTSAMST